MTSTTTSTHKRPVVRIFPPLTTVLNINMSLIIIGHTGLAAGDKGQKIINPQTISKSGYSGMTDEDDEELEIVSVAQKMYGRLFAPDSILVRGDEDIYQTQELFPLSASRAASTNQVEITMQKRDAAMVEMDNVGLSQWRGPTANSDTRTSRPRVHFSPSAGSLAENTTASTVNLLPKALSTSDVPDAPAHAESEITAAAPDTDSSDSDSEAPIRTDAVASSSSTPFSVLTALHARPHRDESIQRVCNSEFAGDWKAMLQATAETITSHKKVLDPKFEDILGEIWSILDSSEVPATKPEPSRKSFHDHVVILCTTARGSELLLDFLRFSNLGEQGILILSKDEPPERMKELEDARLTFIQGDPTNIVDLDRCFINVASKIIILSNPYFSDDDREGADSSTIMAHLDVHKLAPKAQVITELVHEPNLKFFRKDQANTTGHPAIKKRLKTKKEKEHYEPQEYFTIPEFASGQVCTLSTLDSLICQIYYQEHIAGVAKGLVYGVNSVLVEQGGLKCRHMPVGEQYHGREFSELYSSLLNSDVLPIALYRCTQMTGAPLPFVFTCPPPNTILHELDNVMVLERDHR